MHRKLTIGSCFSGIGGLELGLERTGGFETKWQIELDVYARRVLEIHWPKVPKYGDIRIIRDGELEKVDLVCGGYPCQPFSLAGKRAGDADARHLWPYMLRIIRELRPKFVLLENVPGHLSMGFGRVLGDLSESGYDAEWSIVSACAMGAPHTRERVFVVAYPTGTEVRDRFHQNETREPKEAFGPRKCDWWSTEPAVARMARGISSQLDRRRCCGLAVVPQVAQKVGEMILGYEKAL